MSLFSDVKTAVRNVTLTALSEFTNPIVIHSYGNGLEPAESYVTINILSLDQKGHHSTSTLANVDEKLSIQVSYEALVQLTFIGSKAGDMIQSFTQRINNNPISLQALKANNLGLMRKTPVRNTPQKRDTKWVDYYNMDVIFNYIVNTDQLVDVVEGVVIADETSEIPVIIKFPESIIYP